MIHLTSKLPGPMSQWVIDRQAFTYDDRTERKQAMVLVNNFIDLNPTPARLEIIVSGRVNASPNDRLVMMLAYRSEADYLRHKASVASQDPCPV